MAFWTDASFEPKRDFRWRIDFGKDFSTFLFPEGIPTFYASSVKKPNFKIATKEYKILNRNHYFPGNVTWDPIEITFIDDTKNTVSKFLNAYFFHAGMQYDDSNKDGMNYIHTADKIDSLKIQITQLDSDGNAVEIWILDNANIINLNHSDLNYENDGLSNYTITVVYDWAYLDGVNYTEELISKLPKTNVAKSFPLLYVPPNFEIS